MEQYYNSPYDICKKVFAWFEQRPAQLMFALKSPCDLVKSVAIQVESPYTLRENGCIVKKSTDTAIDCLILRHGRSKDLDDVLIFHLHGGAFVFSKPLSHMGYLRNFAREWPGATIITPDYGLSPEHKYPTAVQQLLDVYLAITQRAKSNISEHLSCFDSKKIVFMGDSCGAVLMLSLCRVLHKLKLQLPEKMFAFYPSIYISPIDRNLSRNCSLLDVFVQVSGTLMSAGAYCPEETHSRKRKRDESELPWYRSSRYLHRLKEIDDRSRRDEIFEPVNGSFDIFKNTSESARECKAVEFMQFA